MELSLIILKKGTEHVFNCFGAAMLSSPPATAECEHGFRVVVILGLKAKPVVSRAEKLFFLPMTLKFKNLTPKTYSSNILETNKLLK